MKQLWAPWRMTYIRSADEPVPACIFCAYPAAGPSHYREHLILVVQPHGFVIMNRFPYGYGHFMVVPRRHVTAPGDLEAAEWAATCELLRAATAAAGRALGTSDFNIGMNLGRAAGAGIADHCHFHVVPRWNGDTNFMPLIGETKVISEHLSETYERLLPELAPLGEGPSP
ncbi:MAG TPA: HIT domain-containing protein [Polyangia bacterium]|nr:HIT domain-containing protein [Polyangia bacterium]